MLLQSGVPMTSRLAGFLLSAVILYFAVHTFSGEQGLSEWSAKQERVAALEAELVSVKIEIESLKSDIIRLTPGTVDPDFVEALAREKLAFVHPNEIIFTR